MHDLVLVPRTGASRYGDYSNFIYENLQTQERVLGIGAPLAHSKLWPALLGALALLQSFGSRLLGFEFRHPVWGRPAGQMLNLIALSSWLPRPQPQESTY